MKKLLTIALALAAIAPASAQNAEIAPGKEELISFGDFNQWLTRNIKESRIIGGETKTVYAVAPTATWDNDNPYNGEGGSPWASSNVMARVAGITKTNTSVYKEERPGHGQCAKLVSRIETCRALGIINIKVLAAGSLFLGQMLEPITGVSDPMKKLNCGMPFTKKPRYIAFDYKVKLSGEPNRIRLTAGLGNGSKVKGKDYADCVLFLQKRWEDANGNVYASRIGTMVHRFKEDTEWVNDARFEIHYGDISKKPFYEPYMGLDAGGVTRYTKNSKGKMVPIKEIAWGSAAQKPTHVVLQFDSSHGGAFVGSPGNTFWIDNVRFGY